MTSKTVLKLIKGHQPKHLDFDEWIDYLRQMKANRMHQQDWLNIIDAANLRNLMPL